jgi:hypothetical protein
MTEQANGQQDNTDKATLDAAAAAQAASAAAAEVLTPDQLHDAAIAATEAWQADPTDEAKAAAQAAVTKAKESFAADKKIRDEAAAKNAAPSEYKLNLPEKSVLTPEYLSEVAAYAKDKKLTNEQAQELVNRDSQLLAKDRQSMQTTMQKQVETMQEGWIATAKNDKELGGEKFAENAEIANRVVKKFGTPEFIELLNPKDGKGIKWGNNPQLFKFLHTIGKAMGDDKLELSGNADVNKSNMSYADQYYANSQKTSDDQK